MRSFTSYSPHYCSLYSLDPDALPFEANLLACRPAVDPPTYLLSQLTVGETASSRSAADRYDFRSVLPQVEAQTGQGGWRLLSKWPELHKGGATTMDEAQAAALRVALTKEVANSVDPSIRTFAQYMDVCDQTHAGQPEARAHRLSWTPNLRDH